MELIEPTFTFLHGITISNGRRRGVSAQADALFCKVNNKKAHIHITACIFFSIFSLAQSIDALQKRVKGYYGMKM